MDLLPALVHLYLFATTRFLETDKIGLFYRRKILPAFVTFGCIAFVDALHNDFGMVGPAKAIYCVQKCRAFLAFGSCRFSSFQSS